MLTVNIEQIPMTSYAMAVNNVAIIRSITVCNDSSESYEELKVKITFDPEFANTVAEHIINLPANESWQQQDIQPSINTSYLCNLTEKTLATTTVQVLSKDDEVLAETKKELEVLDYCQYWGNTLMSQYLAAFVTPRHIALDPIIKRASDLLAKWTGDSALTAYLHDVPNRPKMIIGAIYEAIAEQNITYCCSTRTLAQHGQKIRTCEELLSEERGKRGCCLDMALLMCSCLEAVGMNPLLIVQDSHAFAGCWLVNDMFVDSVNDDPSVITKRIAEGINEIILVETTCANEGNKMSFNQAVTAANDKINDLEKFSFVLDVARARLVGVQPIPQRIYNGNEYEVINPEPDKQHHSSPEKISETFTFKKDENEFSRFDLWERRLLDLSTRNNLLNIHLSNNMLRIMVPSLDDMVKMLSKNKETYIVERPDDWDTDAKCKDLGERINLKDSIRELLRKELDKNTLRSYQDSSTLTKNLTSLYRSARLSIEESGANTLFITFGFLKWYEPGKAFPHFAPIVLFPIKLERKSANKGYYMVSRGEDPILNETLFELLKQNYDIDIPDVTEAIQNENGLDIKYILAAVRKAIMVQDKWDVIEESIISIFDFNRFVIWNDLRTNREAMSKHPLIQSLINGQLHEDMVYDDNAVAVNEVASTDIALPISADSSQLAAICEAASGKSFVLHGPPGTGKSQTITNIISNALFQGKRVLFVAEKMAALEVVQKRLAAIGLDPFCLELHSNKTKKSLVMDQLRKTTEVIQQMNDDSFAKEAAHIDELKRELNAHVDGLHKVHGCGLSIYDCFVRYSEIDIHDAPTIIFSDDYIENLSAERLREHTELVENYESAARSVAEYNNALREVNLMEYSPKTRETIQNQIEAILSEIKILINLRGELSTVLGTSIDNLSREQYAALNTITEILLDGQEIPSNLIANIKEDLLKALHELTEFKKQLDNEKHQLLTRFNEYFLNVDYRALRQRWMAAEHKWFLAKYLDRRSIVNTISSHTHNGKRIDVATVPDILTKLDTVHRLQKECDELIEYIDKSYNIKRELKNADAQQIHFYHNRLSILKSAASLLADIWPQIVLALTNDISINDKVLKDYNSTYNNLLEKVSALEQMAVATLSQTGIDWLAWLSNALTRWQSNIINLRSKVGYNVIRKQMSDNNINIIVEWFESGDAKPCDIAKAYLKSVYKHCANHHIEQNNELGYFQSILFEDKIKRFRKLCKEFENITHRELVMRMTEMLPALRKEASQSSDVGYLQKCIRNGCRGVSIRKLFESIPDLISRMCPTMLMSPLSVSQYLGANWPQFDLIVFDEASQMPTCEAIAAISRGKSAIIVGDEHQLPPTNFFMADNFCEQHSESEDLESILEDCLALSMSQKHLLWHYRSKHESLITFSNRIFYKNSLMTFPSNDDMATKVSFEYVKGTYNRGTGRNNKEEAKSVVKEIQNRLSDPQTASQSIGVVTFNVNQQTLIEDMLNDMLRKNSDLEAVAAKMHEPIFIKNLENVQGDERDVILFSIGYGRDQFGKVAMNFGPLNRDGGERRLNVAVSRARYEMKVFSSLKADDIDLYRTNAKGVKCLKSFLDYAERGNIALMHMEYGTKRKTKDAFIESVATALKAKGHTVNTNIGTSEYRVDIGIVDPTNPDRYLLGLLCDGYNYVASNTAHDRDVTTPSVLSLLGWRTYNIWSLEWWDTPEHVLNGIIREIERINSTDDENNEETIVEEPAPINNTTIEEAAVIATEYTPAELSVRHADSAMFSQGYYTDSVVNDIQTIIEAEAPISRRFLIKRLLNSYDISRNGVRINAYLTEVFKDMNLVTSGTDDIFFWKSQEQRDNYSEYRMASGREALDIAPEEVTQAVLQVIKEQFAIDEDGLISETARLFGYACVRDNVHASMKRGIDLALSINLIKLDGERHKLS
ncbi:MAG: DUF3320 domain-containing protein [Muribaculaceae bacterium]|nr:DUF3320 domain-containing protein [Muribaculaceae bacterium]